VLGGCPRLRPRTDTAPHGEIMTLIVHPAKADAVGSRPPTA
jgi:hypothetical protein